MWFFGKKRHCKTVKSLKEALDWYHSEKRYDKKEDGSHIFAILKNNKSEEYKLIIAINLLRENMSSEADGQLVGQLLASILSANVVAAIIFIIARMRSGFRRDTLVEIVKEYPGLNPLLEMYDLKKSDYNVWYTVLEDHSEIHFYIHRVDVVLSVTSS